MTGYILEKKNLFKSIEFLLYFLEVNTINAII